MSEEKRPYVVYGAIAANLLIAVTKFIAAAITLSSAMLSEGIHSVVDTGNQLLLLVGVKRSKRKPDEMHPFGHGKELYFWGLIVAIALFGIGGGMSVYEGITHLQHPEELSDPTANYVVLLIAAVFESVSFTIAAREFMRSIGEESIWKALRSSKDPSLYVVLLEDSAALVGLALAFLGIYLGHALENIYLDGVASILIGCVLAMAAIFLASETKGLLVGETADLKTVRGIKELVAHEPAVEGIDKLLTMQLGPKQILLNMQLRFQTGISTADLSGSIDQITKKIRHKYPMIQQIFIEAGSLNAK